MKVLVNGKKSLDGVKIGEQLKFNKKINLYDQNAIESYLGDELIGYVSPRHFDQTSDLKVNYEIYDLVEDEFTGKVVNHYPLRNGQILLEVDLAV